MLAPQACIAQASSSYHVQVAAINAVIEHGLPAGTVQDGRVGPMSIPVQWLPVFGLMGIDQNAVVSDACENIYAGTWIMAFMSLMQDAQIAESRDVEDPKLSSSLQQRRKQWSPVVRYESEVSGMPSALIDAVITVESRYQPRARSPKNAIGMMQLLPTTADMFGGDPWDPAQNIVMGSRYLARLAKQFQGDLALTLAAYNAGPANVTRVGYHIPAFGETQAYVPKVIALYKAFQRGA